eukprot:GGOE01054768.1.p1 GENE.GGOE01054768.1~~GGOE01054768.1.p1  ORF type:complete len:189 (+),score=63.02 GGOE01054768.1:87-653(+)
MLGQLQTELLAGLEEFNQWMDQFANYTQALVQNLTDAVHDDSTAILPAVKGFVEAVNWTEPFLLALGAFHLLMGIACLAVVAKGSEVHQFGLFAVIGSLILVSQPLNTLLAGQWENITTQPYFDEHGSFFCAVFSTPLLAMAFALVITLMVGNIRLLRKTVMAKAKARGRKSQKQGDGEPASTKPKGD